MFVCMYPSEPQTLQQLMNPKPKTVHVYHKFTVAMEDYCAKLPTLQPLPTTVPSKIEASTPQRSPPKVRSCHVTSSSSSINNGVSSCRHAHYSHSNQTKPGRWVGHQSLHQLLVALTAHIVLTSPTTTPFPWTAPSIETRSISLYKRHGFKASALWSRRGSEGRRRVQLSLP